MLVDRQQLVILLSVAAVVATGCEPQSQERMPRKPAVVAQLPDSQPSWNLPDRVTYAQHVAPILYQSCSGCHRVGEAGPFPLMSYQDAAPRAGLIKAVTGARYMPPWPADPSYRRFINENVLTDEQIAFDRALGRPVRCSR